MNKKMFALAFTLTFVGFLFFCGIESFTSVRKSVVGKWAYVLSYEGDSVNIKINIDDKDSTFTITLILLPNNTLLNLYGRWIISSDSIHLLSEAGEVLDTTADPDTMAQIPDSLATQEITLIIKINDDDKWIIRVKHLGPVIDNFPLSEDDKDKLKMLQFPFYRED